MSKRAYGLFSQVVSYADFLKGFSYISLNGVQAVGAIDVPSADWGAEEIIATHFCHTVSIDSFIQVLGLLMNSSDMVTDEKVMVASGVGSTLMSSAMNFDRCRPWTVYTKYKALDGGQAAGDIFVLTRDGALIMTIAGVQFTKLLISKLEKSLDSANSGASQGRVSKEKVVSNTMPALSEPPSTEGSEALPDLSSSTSVQSEERLGTPKTVNEASSESLRNIITGYTGLSAVDITEDANIATLGVDSLAAVELAEDLLSRFRKPCI